MLIKRLTITPLLDGMTMFGKLTREHLPLVLKELEVRNIPLDDK